MFGTTANPAGARFILKWSVDGVVHSRRKTGGSSFRSSHDPREIIGLGMAKGVERVKIRCPKPSMRVKRLADLPVNRYYVIVEGKGIR